MKLVLYALIVALSFAAPVSRLDIAKLEPVEAIAVEMMGDDILLKTDGGTIGVGKTVSEAIDNLKENSASVIYLKTARYLLLGDGTEQHLRELKDYFKRSVQVAEYHGGDVSVVAKHLDTHWEQGKPKA